MKNNLDALYALLNDYCDHVPEAKVMIEMAKVLRGNLDHMLNVMEGFRTFAGEQDKETYRFSILGFVLREVCQERLSRTGPDHNI